MAYIKFIIVRQYDIVKLLRSGSNLQQPRATNISGHVSYLGTKTKRRSKRREKREQKAGNHGRSIERASSPHSCRCSKAWAPLPALQIVPMNPVSLPPLQRSISHSPATLSHATGNLMGKSSRGSQHNMNMMKINNG